MDWTPDDLPMPEVTRKWRYDHCPLTYHKRDPQWHAITDTGTLAAGLLRLVSGYDPDGDTFSRGPDSFLSLDLYSIGIAHWYSGTAPDLLAEMAQRQPAVMAWGFGEDRAQAMRDPEWLPETVGVAKGKMSLRSSVEWLCRGWYEVARWPALIQIQAEAWLDSYARDAAAEMRAQGWRSNRAFAALARLANSRGGSGMRRMVRRGIDRADTTDEHDVIEVIYESEDLYDHPERIELIDSMPEFSGLWDGETPTAAGLDCSTPRAERVDGSVPVWAERMDEFFPWLIRAQGFGVR